MTGIQPRRYYTCQLDDNSYNTCRFDKIDYILNIEGTVHCANTFTDHPSVINGCSDLMVEIFGENGKHTRSALGANALAFDICVEISLTLVTK
jgi:enamine deaminase RidA (YjgF/YER057c/UK114 family)